jgi:hypothetical protein
MGLNMFQGPGSARAILWNSPRILYHFFTGRRFVDGGFAPGFRAVGLVSAREGGYMFVVSVLMIHPKMALIVLQEPSPLCSFCKEMGSFR